MNDEEPKLPLTVDSPIAWAEYLIDHKALREFYDSRGIHCFMCCAAEAESFAQGAKVHEGGPYGGFNAEKVVGELNELAVEHPFDPAKVEQTGLLKRLADLLFPSE